MYKLIVTELAHRDLDNIASYIAVQLANSPAASDFFDKVDRCYGYLERNPMEKEGYRKAVIKNYILVYKVDEIGKTVIVLRFFYGARDYTKLI